MNKFLITVFCIFNTMVIFGQELQEKYEEEFRRERARLMAQHYGYEFDLVSKWKKQAKEAIAKEKLSKPPTENEQRASREWHEMWSMLGEGPNIGTFKK